MRLNGHLNFLAGAGLYAAKGLSGTVKGNSEGMSPFAGPYAYSFNYKVDFSKDVAFSSQNTTFIKAFDFGFNVLAGLEFRRFQLTAKYSRGFSEIYSDNGYNYKNAIFEFSIAYLFLAGIMGILALFLIKN